MRHHRGTFLPLAALVVSGCSCDENLGQLEGAIKVEPGVLEFGQVPVGAEKKLPLTLRNTGSFTLEVLGFSAPAPFVAPVMTGTIGAGMTRMVDVGFLPTAIGPATAELAINSDDEDAPTVTVSLGGTGIEAAVKVEPLLVDFGEVLWTSDTMPERRTVMISNPGSDAFDLTALELIDDGMGAFALEPQMAVRNYGPGVAEPFEVSYLPNRMGLVEGSVRITTTAPNGGEIVVRLRGTGVGPEMDVCAQPTGGAEVCLSNGTPRLDFGPLDIGGMASGVIRVVNVGDRDLTASGLTQGPVAAFMLAPDPAGFGSFTLAPGRDQQFNVGYTAADYLFDSIIVGFGSNAAVNRSAAVRVEGRVRRPDIQINPARVTISLEGAANRDMVTFRISNCGTAPLTINGALSLTQTMGPVQAFSLGAVPGAGTTLPVPADCMNDPPGATFDVVFQTTTNGLYEAQITVPSDDPVDPMVTVEIAATKR